MTHDEFLNKVIDQGIKGARRDYANKPDKLKGAIEGFEACRNKSVEDLYLLLDAARKRKQQAKIEHAANCWEIICYEAEIEWVCNCISALLVNEGKKPIITPTARGMLLAAKIVGVKSITNHPKFN